jgi:hypothetical protein
VNIAKAFAACYWKVRIDFFARRIARRIAPELRQDACRKLTDRRTPGNEFKNYLDTRAAQLAQPLVDNLLRKNRQIPSLLGNKLVMSAAAKAAAIALKVRKRRNLAA